MASGRASNFIARNSSTQKFHADRATPTTCFGHGGSPRAAFGSEFSFSWSLCLPRLAGSPSLIWRRVGFGLRPRIAIVASFPFDFYVSKNHDFLFSDFCIRPASGFCLNIRENILPHLV